MSKRRAQAAKKVGMEEETYAVDRRRRSRDRDRRRKPSTAASKGLLPGKSPLRRALLLGIPAGAVVTAVVVLVFFNPFTAPCLVFQAIPAQSGTPAFPSHSTTNFNGTWCPNATSAATIHVQIRVAISGQLVGIPPAIGRNSSYTSSGRTFECDLPILTHPATPTYPSGVVTIASPWTYVYTLGEFFSVWQQSYSGAYVNSTHASAPISYNVSEVLGFKADASHEVDLFVDGQRSSSGPGLELNTLPFTDDANPSCINTVWGSGHIIAIAYGPRGATVAPSLGAPPMLRTLPAAERSVPGPGGASLPSLTPLLTLTEHRATAGTGNLSWLCVRVAPFGALPRFPI